MEAKPARWSQSFNKFRLMKNLRSCPDFPISSWTGPSPAVFGVWEPSIQIILSSLTLQRRKWGSPTGVSCAPTKRWWDQSMPSPPQSTPPPQPSALLVLCTASWPGHVHPGFLEFTPDAGRWHRLLSHHAGVFLSKPLSRFSFARGQSNSGTSYPYLVCRFISSLNHCMLAWSGFLDLHWPGITWKQISHFLKDSSHVFRLKLIFGAHDVAAPSIILGAF